MGALLGLSLGAGLLLLWQSLVGPGRPRPPRTGRRGLRVRLADLIAEAGLESVSRVTCCGPAPAWVGS